MRAEIVDYGCRHKETVMPRRKWDSKKKSEIVMRGLKGAVIADLCAEYGISQTQYYQ